MKVQLVGSIIVAIFAAYLARPVESQNIGCLSITQITRLAGCASAFANIVSQTVHNNVT